MGDFEGNNKPHALQAQEARILGVGGDSANVDTKLATSLVFAELEKRGFDKPFEMTQNVAACIPSPRRAGGAKAVLEQRKGRLSPRTTEILARAEQMEKISAPLSPNERASLGKWREKHPDSMSVSDLNSLLRLVFLKHNLLSQRGIVLLMLL